MSGIDTLVFCGITAVNPFYVDIKLFILVVISLWHFRQTFRVVQFPFFISYSLYCTDPHVNRKCANCRNVCQRQLEIVEQILHSIPSLLLSFCAIKMTCRGFGKRLHGFPFSWQRNNLVNPNMCQTKSTKR